ncbi:MAG: hypothetical protein NTY61_02270, partial [Candidatus Parcubacteria bacterium]|nr:hypothetical protein [Candidatus Parcubacteria bacterium]
LEKSAKLIGVLRKELGSVALEDIREIDEPTLTDAEHDARANDAEIFYMRHMKKVLAALTYKQLVNIGEAATTDMQLQFDRGTINGIYLVMEWFTQQLSISRARFQKEDKTEPGEIL